jgi:hypothetical protein
MHQAARDQLIFVGDAVLRHLNQMVSKRGPGELCSDGHCGFASLQLRHARLS